MYFFAKPGKTCIIRIKKLPSLRLGSGVRGILLHSFADFDCNSGAKLLHFFDMCKLLPLKSAEKRHFSPRTLDYKNTSRPLMREIQTSRTVRISPERRNLIVRVPA